LLLPLLFLLCLLLFASGLLLLATLFGSMLLGLLPGIAGSLTAALIAIGGTSNFTIVFAPSPIAAGFARRNAGLLRRHLGRAVRLACYLGGNYVAAAEFARPANSCDGRTPVVLRGEHLAVLAGSALMLHL